MTVTMNAYGILTITAENPLEEYALRTWRQEACLSLMEPIDGEYVHWQGSKLVVTTQTTSATPDPTLT